MTELADLGYALGQMWTPETVQNILNKIDLDKNGVIQMQEFEAWFNTPVSFETIMITPNFCSIFLHLYFMTSRLASAHLKAYKRKSASFCLDVCKITICEFEAWFQPPSVSLVTFVRKPRFDSILIQIHSMNFRLSTIIR